MFLPGILSLAIAFAPQGAAGEPWTVTAGAGHVAEADVALVRADVPAALRELQRWFPGLPRQPFRVFVHESGDALPAALQSMHHPGSPGFALLARHEIHLLQSEIAQNGRGLHPVLVHELVHELLSQRAGRFGDRLPRWFHEGLAQVLAGDTYLGVGEEMIVWRVAAGRELPFSELVDGFPSEPMLLKVAYAQSYSYVAWLERHVGMSAVLGIVDAVDAETSFDRALVDASYESTAALTDGWRDHVVNGSGARWRTMLRDFFALSMVLALPLLALALIRRLRVDRRARERLEQGDRVDAENARQAARLREQYGPFPPAGFWESQRIDGDDAESHGDAADQPPPPGTAPGGVDGGPRA